MMRIATPLIALLLCGTALSGCASDNGGILGSSNKAVPITGKTTQTATAGLPTDIESGVRQAKQQRLAGNYDDAIHTLSQIMLIASDDPRVIGEYGKTLAEKGRAQDAVQFLSRATELQPSDWSLYSALGVSYDQLGDQASARTAYEHALKLKPNDPSVLNNYALSRMMANDPVAARQLIARAQSAGGASDAKIARNIEMVNKLAPEAVAEQKAAAASAPMAAPVSAPAPAIVTSQPLSTVASTAQTAPAKQTQQHSASVPASVPGPQVVMQKVPVDPLAGPVKSATHEPTPLASHAVAKTDVKDAHTGSEKSATVASAAKPELKTDTKAATLKPEVKPDTRTAKAEPVAAKPIDAKAVKAADVKPDAKSDAKGTKSKIPALRQTASAY